MLQIPGCSALSDFRIAKLLNGMMQAIGPKITGVSAYYLHFVDLLQDLDARQQAILNQLLAYGSPVTGKSEGDERFLVVPRPGSISPWSSKATEIANRCGISQVKRIERGIEFHIGIKSPLSDPIRHRLASLIHDRMTQIVVFGHQDPGLFDRHDPKWLTRIDVIDHGGQRIEEGAVFAP